MLSRPQWHLGYGEAGISCIIAACFLVENEDNSVDKTYNPHAIEQRWYETWEKRNYFAPTGGEQAYCIMIPPPNVTGSLHMGHAFQDTIMDALIRYHRMKGDNTLWQVGTDHAGIATQMVVERQLEAENKNRHDLGRDNFIERVWQGKQESGGTITRQLRRMGTSVDWSRERFTMDDGLSEAVNEVFVRLYQEGLIYRGERLVKHFGRSASHMELKARPWHESVIEAELAKTDILINASAMGRDPEETPIPGELLPPDILVMDLHYVPEQTRLLKEAEAAGAKRAMNGDFMLIEQTAAAFTLWTGEKAPVDVIKKTLKSARNKPDVPVPSADEQDAEAGAEA